MSGVLSGPGRTALRAVLGSTGSAVDDLRTVHVAVRAGLPLSRRIGFVSIAGGSGTTTAVASVAAVLAARRGGSILAVDADGGHAGLGRHFGAAPNGEDDGGLAAEDAEHRRSARTAAEASRGLPQVRPRLRLLDLNDPGAAEPAHAMRVPRSVADWTDQLGPIARFYDLVLTDWGVRPPSEDLDMVAASGHVLAVVSRADQQAAAVAANTVAGLQRLPQPPRLLLVLVDVNRTPTPPRISGMLEESLGVTVHRLPFDAAVGTDWLHTRSRPRGASRRAYPRLAAALVTEAVRSQAPGRLPAVTPPVPPPVAPRRAVVDEAVRPA